MRSTLLATCLLTLCTALGCVERTITVTSEPEGALVYLNDTEVGRTPLTVPFEFYGTYDVRLQKAGYEPLITRAEAKTPWWDLPGPDLVAEAVPNGESRIEWHFEMTPAPAAQDVNADALLERAQELQERTIQGR